MITKKDVDRLRTVINKFDKAKKKVKIAKSSAKVSVKKSSVVPKSPAKKVVKKDNLNISTIAAGLDIDPKVARAKMRRQFGKQSEGKWPKTSEAIKKILEVDARKKA